MKQSRSPVATTPAPKQIRAAVYCRKSTEHGLGQEFNSIDAQRDAAEAYIATMKHAGWVCLPEHYSDGGWSGGNTERPALQRLLGDVEAGKIDAVVVHRIDRLSRSLLDFTQMLTTFEQRGVSFASVTQSFDTASSMGRLTMHIDGIVIGVPAMTNCVAKTSSATWVNPAAAVAVNPTTSRFRRTLEEALFMLGLLVQGVMPEAGKRSRPRLSSRRDLRTHFSGKSKKA